MRNHSSSDSVKFWELPPNITPFLRSFLPYLAVFYDTACAKAIWIDLQVQSVAYSWAVAYVGFSSSVMVFWVAAFSGRSSNLGGWVDQLASTSTPIPHHYVSARDAHMRDDTLVFNPPPSAALLSTLVDCAEPRNDDQSGLPGQQCQARHMAIPAMRISDNGTALHCVTR